MSGKQQIVKVLITDSIHHSGTSRTSQTGVSGGGLHQAIFWLVSSRKLHFYEKIDPEGLLHYT